MKINGSSIGTLDDEMLEYIFGVEIEDDRKQILMKLDQLMKAQPKEEPVKILVLKRQRPIDIKLQEIIDNKDFYTDESCSALDWLKN